MGDVSRHFAIAPELHDMTGAAEVADRLAIPNGDQYVRTCGNPGARLGILPVSFRTVVADGLFRATRCEWQRRTFSRVTAQPTKLGP